MLLQRRIPLLVLILIDVSQLLGAVAIKSREVWGLARDVQAGLQRSEVQLGHRRSAVTQAMAPIVVHSPLFQVLFVKPTEASMRLRTLYVLYRRSLARFRPTCQTRCTCVFLPRAARSDRIDPDDGKPFHCDDGLLAASRQTLEALRTSHLACNPVRSSISSTAASARSAPASALGA